MGRCQRLDPSSILGRRTLFWNTHEHPSHAKQLHSSSHLTQALLFVPCILGRVVKALDLSPNGPSPRGFEPRRMHSVFVLLSVTDVSLAQLGRALGF